MSVLLRVSGLRGGYKDGLDILRGIDLSVGRGEALGIIGLNGSGKSTLGKAILNMIPFRRGEISFDGRDVTSLSTHELVREGLSIMQQGGRVFGSLSVRENLSLAAAAAPAPAPSDLLTELFPLLCQGDRRLRHLPADRLSGGQRHQLALAMALSSSPQLLILDEPSAGLSPLAVGQMYDTLGRVRRMTGVSIILIEQNISRADAFCGRCALIRDGAVAASFASGELESIEKELFNKQ